MKKIKLNETKLSVLIDSNIYSELLSKRQTKKNDKERGGVLLGKLYPSLNEIVVTHVIESESSNSYKYGISLDVGFLKNEIDRIWKESKGQITYLGDWHTHPEAIPKPSIQDYKTFVINYYKSKRSQNLLFYLIIGNKNIFWNKHFNGYKFQTYKLNKII